MFPVLFYMSLQAVAIRFVISGLEGKGNEGVVVGGGGGGVMTSRKTI